MTLSADNLATDDTWVSVCALSDIPREEGVAVLVDGKQIAIFRTFAGQLYALENTDPFTGANVLSRGIVGTRGDRPTVASPLHKQVFDLATGACLDEAGAAVASYPVRLVQDLVEIAVS